MKRLLLIPLFVLVVLACSLWTPYDTQYFATATATPTPTATLSPTPTITPPARSCRVTAIEALNLRTGPGLSFSVLDWLKPGDLVTITKNTGAWLAVTSTGGRAGWVKAEFCEIGE